MDINDLYVGQKYVMEKSFTTEDVLNFSEISMDNNPIHIDESYAKSSIFENRIVHGFLTASLFSAIIGTKMPGNGSIYIKQTMNFRKPVYHNQTIRATVKVISINKVKRLVELETTCCDIANNILIDGEALVKLL
ncbi:MAG: MaoC family dehydratase [Bacteroidales bacterium]|nr:MaoC family dehydratase [Bacteroidales bacterium]